MLGYVTLGITDMERSTAFYDGLFAEIGAKMVMDMGRIKFYGTGEGAMVSICIPFDEEQQNSGNGNMIAIPGGSPEGVQKLYAKAIELGATDDGEPGDRVADVFYGAYVRDADNNKICFFHMST